MAARRAFLPLVSTAKLGGLGSAGSVYQVGASALKNSFGASYTRHRTKRRDGEGGLGCTYRRLICRPWLFLVQDRGGGGGLYFDLSPIFDKMV